MIKFSNMYFFFYLGWLFLSISFFFKHTKGFQWIGLILLFLFSFYIIKKEWRLLLNTFRNPLIILIIFLICLFWFVLISPYKMASLEAFLLNYFFHVILFFLFLLFAYKQKNTYFSGSLFWYILGAVTLLCIFYYYFYVFKNCNYLLSCTLSSPFIYLNQSLFKGVVSSSAPFVFSFLAFLGLFLSIKNKKRYLYFLISFSIFLFLIYIGRRAALLGIFLSFLFLFLFSQNKVLKKLAFSLIVILLLIIGIFLSTHEGKIVLIKSRDNISLLLTSDPKNWAQSGNMGMRLYIWPIYFKKSLEEPFYGTGLGRRVQKRVLSETNKKALSLEHSHILFLNLALQAGWHTSLIFLFFYLWTFKKGYQLWKNSNESPFFTFLFLFLITFFIMSLFEGMEEGTRFTTFWITSGLVWGYEQRYQEKSSFST